MPNSRRLLNRINRFFILSYIEFSVIVRKYLQNIFLFHKHAMIHVCGYEQEHHVQTQPTVFVCLSVHMFGPTRYSI